MVLRLNVCHQQKAFLVNYVDLYSIECIDQMLRQMALTQRKGSTIAIVILRYAVGLINKPLVGIGKIHLLSPTQRSVSN